MAGFMAGGTIYDEMAIWFAELDIQAQGLKEGVGVHK